MRALVPALTAVAPSVVLALAAAGCASEPPPRPASGAGTVLLRTDRLPGLMGTSDQLDPPDVTLYGDGRAIVEHERKGPLPRLSETRIAPEEIREIFADAAEAGLFEGRAYDVDGIADAGVLRIVIRSARGVHTTEVAAPSADDGGDRGAAIAFADGLRSRLGRGDPYSAGRLGVYVTPEDDPPATVRDWPGPPPPGDGACLTLRGEEAREMSNAVWAAWTASGNVPGDVVWRADDTTFRAWFRPLLPHEADCRAAVIRS